MIEEFKGRTLRHFELPKALTPHRALKHHLGAAEEVRLVEHMRLKAPGVELAGELASLLGRHRPEQLLAVGSNTRDGPLRLKVHAHEKFGELELRLGPLDSFCWHLKVVNGGNLVDTLERTREGERNGADVDTRPPRGRAKMAGKSRMAYRRRAGDRR